MMELDVVALHERALEATLGIVVAVRPDQLSRPTPCPGLDVRAMIEHLVQGNLRFAKVADGEPYLAGDDGTEEVAGEVGDDPVASLAASVGRVAEAWRRPGVLDQMCRLPFGDMPGRFALALHLVEVLVHGWDVAKATGLDTKLEPELAGAALRTVEMAVTDDLRGPGGPFGPEVEVPEDAPVGDRLVAFLGRQP